MKIINSVFILSTAEIVIYNSIRNLKRLFDKETAQLRKGFLRIFGLPKIDPN